MSNAHIHSFSRLSLHSEHSGRYSTPVPLEQRPFSEQCWQKPEKRVGVRRVITIPSLNIIKPSQDIRLCAHGCNVLLDWGQTEFWQILHEKNGGNNNPPKKPRPVITSTLITVEPCGTYGGFEDATCWFTPGSPMVLLGPGHRIVGELHLLLSCRDEAQQSLRLGP